MFNKTVCRIVSVFVFALFVQIGFGQFVDPQTALDRLADEIVQVQDAIEEAESVQFTGSFQSAQEASILDRAYLKMLKVMEEDILTMKSVEESFNKVNLMSEGLTSDQVEMFDGIVQRVENLLS